MYFSNTKITCILHEYNREIFDDIQYVQYDTYVQGGINAALHRV
jgi:hypothetical protein